MKTFKLFNVFNDSDQDEMESWISRYLSDAWNLEKLDSVAKELPDGTTYTEYQIIMNEDE